MKKIIILLFMCIVTIHYSSVVFAKDLHATIEYESIYSPYRYIVYITDKGELCRLDYLDNDRSLPPVKRKQYFEDIKSLSSDYTVNAPYFIDNEGCVWAYETDTENGSRIKIEEIKDCVKLCTGGTFFNIALLSDGTVWSWGTNEYGQLGNGTTEFCETPCKISGLEDIVDIAAGERNAIAVDSEGNVYVWGANRSKNERWNDLYPVKVQGLSNCIKVEKNQIANIVLNANGELYIWHNESGFDNVHFQEYEPLIEKNIGKCIKISSNFYSTIILNEEGTTFLWDTFTAERFKRTTQIDNVKQVTDGARNCYICEDNTVWLIDWDERYGDSDMGEPQCLISEIAEDKIKVGSISFIKRYAMAEKMAKLYEELGEDTSNVISGIYDDISDSAYRSDIEKCYTYGLMNGTSDTSFSPNKVLRREQAAIIVDRLLQKTGIEATSLKSTSKYVDDEEISSWAKESVYNVSGLFDIEDNIFNPKEYVSAEELDEIITRVKSL